MRMPSYENYYSRRSMSFNWHCIQHSVYFRVVMLLKQWVLFRSGCCCLTRLQPLQINMTTLFVPLLPAAVGDKINGIANSLNQTLSALREAQATPIGPSSLLENSEISRLQSVIGKLEKELGSSFHILLLYRDPKAATLSSLPRTSPCSND